MPIARQNDFIGRKRFFYSTDVMGQYLYTGTNDSEHSSGKDTLTPHKYWLIDWIFFSPGFESNTISTFLLIFSQISPGVEFNEEVTLLKFSSESWRSAP